MNVLLVNTHPNGGAAKACIQLHLALLKAGVASRLLFLHKEDSQVPESYEFRNNPSKSERILFKIKEKVHFFRYLKPVHDRPPGYEGFHPATSIYDITQHPAYAWADVINLHWVASFIDFASFFAKNTKPVVWTLHDMWPFTGGYHYEKGFPKTAYTALIQRNLKLKNKALRNAILKIVSPSKWLLERSQSSTILQHFDHHHIPNSLNSCLFQPLEKQMAREVLRLPQDKKIILFVADAVHNRRKGFEIMLNAFRALSTQNVALAVIGKYRGKFPKADNLYFLDQIANEKFLRIGYSAADLFVISSVEDNFPNTILESLFCGLPVVGFEIGGIPDMIENGKNGWLCPTINAGNLAGTIQKALQTPFDHQAIRAKAIEKYNPETQAKKYIDLFETVTQHQIAWKARRDF